MINLIPAAAKKSLRLEYWVRVFSVWMIAWSIALVISACILFPAYVLIQSQVQVYRDSALAAKEKVVDYENVSVDLVGASQQAKFSLDEGRLFLFSEYVNLFENLQGEGVLLTDLSIDRSVSSEQFVSLQGVAVDRKSLAAFRDRLLEREEIGAVDLPISNLARDSDITFNITVTLKSGNETDV